MNRATLLVSVVLVVACKGPTGPQGPAGPSGPPAYKRSASYCNTTSTDVAPANSWTLTASCTNVADLPIEGWCYEPMGLPTGAFRNVDSPMDWADTTKVAGWLCRWSWNGGTPAPFPGIVEICCATPG